MHVVHDELFSLQFGQTKQYTVNLGSSDTNLNEDIIQTKTCPSSTSGSIQVPAVMCETDNMTVTLAAKELKEARFVGKLKPTVNNNA